jgi:hypothetical protein
VLGLRVAVVSVLLVGVAVDFGLDVDFVTPELLDDEVAEEFDLEDDVDLVVDEDVEREVLLPLLVCAKASD